MKSALEKRLAALQSEYDAGQKMLAELDEKRTNLTRTMLRIDGAIQVLRELLEASSADTENSTAPSADEPPPA